MPFDKQENTRNEYVKCARRQNGNAVAAPDDFAIDSKPKMGVACGRERRF
jgi:hypothetical protein